MLDAAGGRANGPCRRRRAAAGRRRSPRPARRPRAPADYARAASPRPHRGRPASGRASSSARTASRQTRSRTPSEPTRCRGAPAHMPRRQARHPARADGLRAWRQPTARAAQPHRGKDRRRSRPVSESRSVTPRADRSAATRMRTSPRPAPHAARTRRERSATTSRPRRQGSQATVRMELPRRFDATSPPWTKPTPTRTRKRAVNARVRLDPGRRVPRRGRGPCL